MARVRVEAEVRPTEDVERVKKAILNVFMPDIIHVEDLGGGYQLVVAESYSLRGLVKLHEKLRMERILDAARSYMLRGIDRGLLVFKLNKQAAFVGRVSLVDLDAEAPLGPIVFTIEHSDPRAVVDWLAPPTKMGRPIYENPMPED
ncbi:RNA-binding domain-containing protein [Pyrofollis japonicus]|uniref:RNA-binding domain-containing protein n=1 Tax=Pyrofollis japonicus TaxID=3060460 RepID=UPI00295ADA34|nr:RNA-binding domain-containing protein [Pyrofollis japonicus]BEP17795.1 RNA-binding domain-containing protein [Pyrofollis japonicus]